MKNMQFFVVFNLFLVYYSPGVSDWKWDDFKETSQSYYYYMTREDLQNFSCLFTTAKYLHFIKQVADSSYTYPLKFIWTNSGKSYFILRPYPNMDHPQKRQTSLQEIQAVKQQFWGFYLDWQNFLISSPFADIPASPEVSINPDTILVSYESGEPGSLANVIKYFLPSGKLVKIEISSGQQKIINYPLYTEFDKKWICGGWDTQIYKNGEVHSGIATRMELQNIVGNWVPIHVEMIVQTAEKTGEKFLSRIFLKEYLFDIPLQEIEQTEPPVQK